MMYRTKTYIAADWTGDHDAVEQLHKWNDNRNLILSFTDAHDLTQSNDSSLNCSIKASLKKRMDVSKTFVLIVGKNTAKLRSGSCSLCNSYNSWTEACARGYWVDKRSYIDYECTKAIEAGIKLVVLYNACSIDKEKCPVSIRNIGTHVAMCYKKDGVEYWNYSAVRDALEK